LEWVEEAIQEEMITIRKRANNRRLCKVICAMTLSTNQPNCLCFCSRHREECLVHRLVKVPTSKEEPVRNRNGNFRTREREKDNPGTESDTLGIKEEWDTQAIETDWETLTTPANDEKEIEPSEKKEDIDDYESMSSGTEQEVLQLIDKIEKTVKETQQKREKRGRPKTLLNEGGGIDKGSRKQHLECAQGHSDTSETNGCPGRSIDPSEGNFKCEADE
jgi:hypothetical protein